MPNQARVDIRDEGRKYFRAVGMLSFPRPTPALVVAMSMRPQAHRRQEHGLATLAVAQRPSSTKSAESPISDATRSALCVAVGDQDSGAFGRKESHRRLANAGRTAGDYCHFACQSICHVLPLTTLLLLLFCYCRSHDLHITSIKTGPAAIDDQLLPRDQ